MISKEEFVELMTALKHTVEFNNSSDKVIEQSNNILDLIRVGDYVNGEKVIEVGKDRLFTSRGRVFVEEIRTVATQEQFRRISYTL